MVKGVFLFERISFPIQCRVRICAQWWNFNSSNPCLYVGGNYNQNTNHGLFYVNYNTASNSNANIGCRILFVLCSSSIHGTGSRAPLGEDKQIWGAG